MKKLLNLLLSIFCFVATAFAQNCDLETNSTDKFTNQTNKSTKEKTLLSDFKDTKSKLKLKSMTVKAVQKDGVYSLYFTWVTPTSMGSMPVPLSMAYGAAITLLLDNKTIVELTGIGLVDDLMTKGTTYSSGRGFVISTTDMDKVIGHKVTDMRVKAQLNGFDAELSADLQSVFSDLLKCVK